MNNQEIIFVSNFIGNGGAARVISVLADRLSQKGYKVTVCYYPVKKDMEEYRNSTDVNYVKFPMKHSHGILYKMERVTRLRDEIKRHPGSTVVSFEYFMNMQTIVAMLGLKNRLVISERNDPARVGGKTPTRQLRNFLYRFADCLVCQTQDAMEYFPKSIQKKSVVIMNPIKSDLPEPWTGERKKEIVNFCRLEKQKNLPLLIDAFEEFHRSHPDYTLTIYGDGKEREATENYIKAKGLEAAITLHPAVQDVHERIKDAMMFVSSSDYEGLSNSMIEAMAIGLPTICTDCPCGGARMVIEDGENGLLVPVGGKSELAEAMKRIASDRKLGEKLSAGGIQIRELLAVERITGSWQEVIG